MKINVNWPGWPIENNPFGKEFDKDARIRMIKGSEALLPLLDKYKSEMGKSVLEIGPFFNPLITPQKFPTKKIFYWENDFYVLKWLEEKFNTKNANAIYCDLNQIGGGSMVKLKKETSKMLRKYGRGKEELKFDTIIASHLLNYIDYRLFLMIIKGFLVKGGLLFINNVANYGLPTFFSDKRPKSAQETIKLLKESGYKVIEKQILPSAFPKHQKNKRLLVIAKNE